MFNCGNHCSNSLHANTTKTQVRMVMGRRYFCARAFRFDVPLCAPLFDVVLFTVDEACAEECVFPAEEDLEEVFVEEELWPRLTGDEAAVEVVWRRRVEVLWTATGSAT